MHLTPSHPMQGFLSFIPDVEVMVRRQRWEEHAAKTKVIKKIKSASIISFDADLLDLPLFRNYLETDDILDGDPYADTNELIVESSLEELEIEEAIEWTDEAVVDMHYNLLKRSIERLSARNNAEEKRDILSWIFSPEVPDEVVRIIDGVKETILIPFTFGTCCRLEGCCPDEMRDRIKTMCRENGVMTH